LVHRLADRRERFLLCAVEKAAGVDDHRVGVRMGARKLVALGAKAGENPLAVDQSLRAAEGDKGDTRRGSLFSLGHVGHAGQMPRARGGGKARQPFASLALAVMYDRVASTRRTSGSASR